MEKRGERGEGRGGTPGLVALFIREDERVRTEAPVDIGACLSFCLRWESHDGLCGSLEPTIADRKLKGLGLAWRGGFNLKVFVENPGREEGIQRTAGVDADPAWGLDDVWRGREHHEITQHRFWRLAFTAVQEGPQVRGNR